MSKYNKVVITTSTYNVADMVEGSTPICDTKILSGNSWSFASNELPATVYYESTSVPKTFVLGTDSHHVEMSDSRTLEQNYRTLLKQHGKEFVGNNEGKITVNNAIASQVLSGEIKGQTVKNYLPDFDKTKWYISSYLSNVMFFNNDTLKIVATGSEGVGIRTNISSSRFSLESNTQYHLTCFVNKNTTVNGFILCNSGSDRVSTSLIKVDGGFTGKYTATFTTKPTFSFWELGFSSIEAGEVEISNIVVTKESVNLTKPIPFGLSSTQAIINNNGASYPIYEPLIYGKTRILRAPKGTQNWVEISDSEARDTVTYDYKLDSIAGDLGSVPSISDYIDRARKVKVVNTEQKIYSGLEDWWKSSLELGSYIQFGLDINANAKEGTTAISDAIVTPFSYSQSAQQEQVIVSANVNKKQLRITILKSKLVSQDVQGFKEWLQANPVTVRYQLATPIEVPLTDEELKAYDAYKKVILLPFAEDKVTLNEDGSGAWIKASKKIENITDMVLLDSSSSTGNYYVFYISNKDGKPSSVLTRSNYNFTPSTTTGIDKEAVIISASKNINFSILKTTIDALSGATVLDKFKAWNAINNISFTYETDTPVAITIDKSIVPTILIQDKINILDVESPVAPSSFTVNVPTSDGVKKEFDLTLQNSWTGTLKAQLLQTGRVRIVGTITAPSSFTNIVANLPTEIKPSVTRKVVGLNGNTPIAIEIDTVPTIKCPTTVTGSVEINAEYEL